MRSSEGSNPGLHEGPPDTGRLSLFDSHTDLQVGPVVDDIKKRHRLILKGKEEEVDTDNVVEPECPR
eukprot:9009658-Pyramimonas_sp.AAC.1